jgi:DNA-binding response OmpR family regulator
MSRIDFQKNLLLIFPKDSVATQLIAQLRLMEYIVTAINDAQINDRRLTGYDAIILDPSFSASEQVNICQHLRGSGILTPVLAHSSYSEKKARINTLHAGADKCLAVPYHHEELQAHIEALIRRDRRTFSAKQLNVEGLTLNLGDLTLQTAAQRIDLTSLEAAVLKCLMQRAPNVVPREYFFEQVWGINNEHTSNRLDVYIKRVRKKLELLAPPVSIQTVHSKGYRLGE